MANYSNTSPYFTTREVADYLDVLNSVVAKHSLLE